MSPVTSVVLVHGAWADGSAWSKIIPLLESKGLNVACVQLPLSSIDDDVAAATRIINAQSGSVLLAGHSYGGSVITQAGINPKVAGLLYVAAFAPDEGETLSGLASRYPPTETFGELNVIEDGYILLTKKGVYEYFAQDLTDAEKAVIFATQGATNFTAILPITIRTAAWRSKPSWFIVAENDKAVHPLQEKETAERMKAEILVLQTSHVPMLAEPQAVANFMIKAVDKLNSGK